MGASAVISRCTSSSPAHEPPPSSHPCKLYLCRADPNGRSSGRYSRIEARSTNNLAINTAQIEAPARLGSLAPATAKEDIAAEIQATLSMKGSPEADKLAYGIISNQFDNQVVGPSHEVISELPPDERLQLLAMALDGCDYGWTTDTYILAEIKDLTVPEVRDAVSRYVARFAPKENGQP
jgi:hypothetical protein